MEDVPYTQNRSRSFRQLAGRRAAEDAGPLTRVKRDEARYIPCDVCVVAEPSIPIPTPSPTTDAAETADKSAPTSPSNPPDASPTHAYYQWSADIPAHLTAGMGRVHVLLLMCMWQRVAGWVVVRVVVVEMRWASHRRYRACTAHPLPPFDIPTRLERKTAAGAVGAHPRAMGRPARASLTCLITSV